MPDLTSDDIRAFAEACGIALFPVDPTDDDAVLLASCEPYAPHFDLNQAAEGLEEFIHARAGWQLIQTLEPSVSRGWRVFIRDKDYRHRGTGFAPTLAAAIVRAVLEAAKAGEGRVFPH